jgi:hypothetical protein
MEIARAIGAVIDQPHLDHIPEIREGSLDLAELLVW